MIGSVLGLAIFWLIFALGLWDKGEKFWSYKLLMPTFIAICALVGAVIGSSTPSDEGPHEMFRTSFALAIGLSVVVAQQNDILHKKTVPTAAALTYLVFGMGGTLLVFDTCRWLNKVA